MDINMSNIIEATPNEKVSDFSNIFDLEKELRDINKAMQMPNGLIQGLASRADDRTYNAEFENFYLKSDALRLVAKRHSWTRATVSSVARATIGAGFSFVRHPAYGPKESLSQDKIDKTLSPIYDFFYNLKEDTRYIQDLITLPAKIYYSVASLVYYGQMAWYLRYDENDQLIGFDVLPGIIRPNINERGRFLRPAYFFRPWNSQQVISYSNPRNIMYVTWPGIDMNIYGSSEYDAVSEISIPSDLYASMAYRNHFENVNAPYNGVWIVDKSTSEEDYKRFLITLINRYSGVVNFGRTPLVIKGMVEFKETRSRSNDDAPYLSGRQYNQEEISAVSGVSSAKMGLASNTTKTNFRDQRRDFHENTLRPIFEILEQSIYQQIFVRGFGIKEWMLAFNSPDLVTSLEAATINTRYIQSGVLNPNEVRSELGRPPRDDEHGSAYYKPSSALEVAVNGESSPEIMEATQDRTPDGGSTNQLAGARVPSTDRPQVNPQDKQNNALQFSSDVPFDNLIKELKSWRTFAIRISEGKRTNRKFIPEYIPEEVSKSISETLDELYDDKDAIKDYFDILISEFVYAT